MIDFKPYVRKPFVVDAVQITDENIAEIAPLVGQLRSNETGQFITVDRKKLPNLYRLHTGAWLTRYQNDDPEKEPNLRGFADRLFVVQFVENNELIQNFLDFLEAGANVG